MKELSSTQKYLNEQLSSCKSDIEDLGAEINGYASGSPEGDVWQYSFTFTASIPPDRAAVTIRTHWRHSYQDTPSEELKINSEVSIFRKGSPSSYSNRNESSHQIFCQNFNLGKLLMSIFLQAKKELESEIAHEVSFVKV